MPKSERYTIGIVWFIMHFIIGNLNDVTTKYLVSSLPPSEIAFLRFFFGTITLLPLMLFYGKKVFYTSRISVHIIRGALLFFGQYVWAYSLSFVPLTTVTMLSFTIPLFVLLMAPIFLREKVTTSMWVATIIGFLGIVVVLDPRNINFNPYSLVIVIAAILFALLDIINKKFIIKETMLGMLFYSAFVTTILGFYPAYKVWVMPQMQDLLLTLFLGIGGNLILYCLLRSFKYVYVSSTAPYRYLEIIISAVLGYLIFAEVPSINLYIGGMIIMPATFYIGYKKLIIEKN